MSSLDEGRAAYDRCDWSEARSKLRAALDAHGLDGPDLERLAWSGRWLRDTETFVDALERAETAFLDETDARGAARCALEAARHHQQMQRKVLALAAYERALGYLADASECPEHAQALWSRANLEWSAGNLDDARAILDEALVIARRTGDPGIEACVLQGFAHVEILSGNHHEGIRLLDRATSLVTSGQASPIHAGFVYCATISACRSLCDWGRATEWTEVATRYCQRQSIAGYTGLCRFHQAEIARLHGRLRTAEAEAEDA